MTDNVCNVAILGAGNMAREHIRAFRDIPEVNIAGIHSRTRFRAQALADEFEISIVADSIPELFQKTHADLVVVAVPVGMMNPVSKACFEFPWTALLEKPAGYTIPDAEDILLSAKKMKRNVLVALNRRFFSSTRTIQESLKNDPNSRFIKVQDQEDLKSARDAGQPQSIIDNWMYANSIHIIDFFQIFGRAKVTTVQPVVPWNPDHPNIVVSYLEYANGDTGIYEGIWNGPAPWSVSVTTKKKRWEARPLEIASYQLEKSRIIETVPQHCWDTTFKPGFRLQAENAVLSALGKQADSPNLDDAMVTMRIVEAIFTPSKKRIALA
ncbi:MAG: Gfo/Idh/MocA family protein [Methanoregula sp.]